MTLAFGTPGKKHFAISNVVIAISNMPGGREAQVMKQESRQNRLKNNDSKLARKKVAGLHTTNMSSVNTYGASVSIKQCRNFKIDDIAVIRAALSELGLKRFRLMSYWDEHEKIQGEYDFARLDAQIKTITKQGGEITLCLGARQPRWPESHWPAWTKSMAKAQRNRALLNFIRTVVERYKHHTCIVSYQLENEALLKNFGQNGDFDRNRLRREYALIKELDPHRPIVMTTSTSWGIPLRRPIPDIVGFSFYRITHNKGAYRKSIYQPWIFKFRTALIKYLWHRPCFIHELQAEPWGPANIWDMGKTEQAKSMDIEILKLNIAAVSASTLYPIDMWGLEWWYWCRQNGQPELWEYIKNLDK